MDSRSYQQILDTINIAICICDKTLRRQYVNPAYCRMSGYSTKELVGTRDSEFYEPKSAKRIEQVNRTKRRNHVSSNYEAVLITKDKVKLPVMIHGTPLKDGRTFAILTDLREQKQKESLYEKLLENMNEGVWMCNAEDYTVYANPKFCDMVGYSLAELQQMTEYEVWHAEDRKRIRHINTETRRKQHKASSYTGNLLSKNQEIIPVHVSASPFADGATIGIFTDLREKKRQESIYATLVENMNQPIRLNDKNHKVVYANPKFCELTGYKLEELVGTSEYALWDKKSKQQARNTNLHERKQGLSSTYEGMLTAKDGSEIPVSVNGSPVSDGGTIGIFTDLREIRKWQQTERILSNALQYTRNAIIVFDREGVVRLWSKGAKIIFGYTQNEMEEQLLEKIFTKEDIHNMLQHSKVLHNFELHGTHKNKSVISISATLTPIGAKEDEEQEHFSYLLIARDITNQMKFEEELTLKYQKMRDAYNQFGIIRRQMDYLFEFLDLYNEGYDFKKLTDFIVSSTIMLTRVDAVMLRKYNEKKKQLELISCFGVNDDWWGNANVPYKDSLAEKAVKNGFPLKVIDIATEPKYYSRSLAKKYNFSSLLLIPLYYRSAFVGTVTLYVTPEKKLEIFENEFIEKYAKLIAVVLGSMGKKK